MKKCLILTASVTVKMIIYRPLKGRKQIEEVEKNSKKSDGMVSRMLRGVLRRLSYLKKVLSIIIKEVLLVALRKQ